MAPGSVDVEKVTTEMDKVSVSLKEGDKKRVGPDRHCAFCLTPVKGGEVKLCGGCKRRAYCSKECQKADWAQPKDNPAFNGLIHGYGQGHKNFCGLLNYGEEDLDWKVAEISGKGLGLVALRDFAPLSRILVEGMQRYPKGVSDLFHPGIKDLYPTDTSDIHKKWKNNSGLLQPETNRLGLRICRTNHACLPNAAVMALSSFDVLVLYADKEIKAGDEICQSYFPIADLRLFKETPEYLSPATYRATLFEDWGIICPPDCFCRGDEGKKLIVLVKICHRLKNGIKLSQQDSKSLESIEKIINLYEKSKAAPSVLQELYALGRDFSLDDFKKAKFYMGKCKEIFSKISHPNEDEVIGKKDPEPVLLNAGDVKMADTLTAMSNVYDEDGAKKGGKDRHCAFCISPIHQGEIVLCEGCEKRAYCSEECQEADWKTVNDKPAFNEKIQGYGQGHRNWCGLKYGEEDLDWKVAEISGKGLGLVALRDLPPLYRIIVEGMQPLYKAKGKDKGPLKYHPGMNDLVPYSNDDKNGATIFQKFNANCVNTNNGGMKIGLRISRGNHSCDANASYTDDAEFNVLILYSNREIKKGEEICYSYSPFNDVFKIINEGFAGRSPKDNRKILFDKYGIKCPPSCPCLDQGKNHSLKICKDLGEECKREYMNTKVLPKMEKILEFAETLGCSPGIMSMLHYHAYDYALTRRETLEQAKGFMEKTLRFNQAIYHPRNGERVEGMEDFLKDFAQKLPGNFGSFGVM